MRNRWSNHFWKQAFVLALLFHIALVAGFLWGTKLFKTKRQVPIPYTVKLFEPQFDKKESLKGPSKAPENKKEEANKKVKPPEAPEKPKAKPPVPVKKEVPKPEPKPKPKPEPKVEKKTPPVTKKEAVSLKPQKKQKKPPVKKKEKKPKVPKQVKPRSNKNKASEKKLQRRINEIQRRLKEQKEEEYLKKRLQELAKKKQRANGSSRGLAGAGTGGSGGVGNRQAMIYGNFVKAKIWRNWHFPKALANRKDLFAVVTIVINKDGQILEMKVKKYSGFVPFDRSIIKAIKDSNPLPPLPPAMGQGPEEIDIRFDLSKAGT